MPILSVDGADLHYDVSGEGRTLVFCSATATHGDVWKLRQVPDLSRDYRVLTFDQRGTGASTGVSKDFSTRRLASDVVALLDHIGVASAIVCGHSNGGRVAQLLALDFPDRVEKLILASSGGASGGKGIPLSVCMSLVEHGFDAYMRKHSIEVGFSKAYAAAHPQDLERFLAVRLGAPPSLENFLRHVIARQDFDPQDRLKTLRVPTLVLVGDDEDHGASTGITHMDYAKSLAAEIPDARLAVLKGQGHYYYYSDWETTNALIREFIEQG